MLLEMSEEKARHLLSLSRELHWAFPSSQGTPIIGGHASSQRVEQAVLERESYAEAARLLLANGDEEGAVEIAANAWRLWVVARDVAGGRGFLDSVLDKGEKKPSRARSLALYGDALLAFRQGKIEESRKRSKATLEAALLVNDPEALTLANLALSRIAFEDGDYVQALSLAVKARGFARSLRAAMGQAPLFLHAQATRMTGDYDKAAVLFEQSLALNRKIEDEGMVMAELQNLGLVEIHRGHSDAAERYFAESERLGFTDGPYSTAMISLYRASIAFVRGDKNGSRTLLQRAESILKEAKMEAAPDDQFEINWLHEQLERN
jgi:tetratricopeptide (TPR) repeat protein